MANYFRMKAVNAAQTDKFKVNFKGQTVTYLGIFVKTPSFQITVPPKLLKGLDGGGEGNTGTDPLIIETNLQLTMSEDLDDDLPFTALEVSSPSVNNKWAVILQTKPRRVA